VPKISIDHIRKCFNVYDIDAGDLYVNASNGIGTYDILVISITDSYCGGRNITFLTEGNFRSWNGARKDGIFAYAESVIKCMHDKCLK